MKTADRSNKTFADTELEIRQLEVKRKLALGWSRLKEDMSFGELITEAEKLVKEGILEYSESTVDSKKSSDYFVRKISGHMIPIISYHVYPNSHPEGGFAHINKYTLTIYDKDGRLSKWQDRSISNGILRQMIWQYHENNQEKQTDYYDFNKNPTKETYMYDEIGRRIEFIRTDMANKRILQRSSTTYSPDGTRHILDQDFETN